MFISLEDERVQTVCANDPILGKLIAAIGDLMVPMRTDYFASLVRSIIGQHISVRAASAIYGRLQRLLDGHMIPDSILALSQEELRKVGLTNQKVQYVLHLAEKVKARELDLEHIAVYDDETIMTQLIQVKGIGKWTAEVFLLLSLGRMDVLAADDVGLQRAAMWLYQTGKAERRTILIEKSIQWKPYRSIASYYLWEMIHLGYADRYASVHDLPGKCSL